MRLIRHIAPGQASPKAVALMAMVRGEFRKPLASNDPAALDDRKAHAVRALSNYMLAVAAPKDQKLKSSMKDFHGRSVQEAKEHQKEQQRQRQQSSSNKET